MPLAERMVQRPRHIVGQLFRAHLVIDGVLAAQRGIAFEIFAHLGGAVKEFVGRTTDVFGSFPDIVIDSRNLGLAHPVGPHDPGPKPLRMMDHDMKRRPLDGNARSLKSDTQLGENIVDETLIARVVCQPVQNVAVKMRRDGTDVGGAFISCSRAATWIDNTGYVVSPIDGVNSVCCNLLARSARFRTRQVPREWPLPPALIVQAFRRPRTHGETTDLCQLVARGAIARLDRKAARYGAVISGQHIAIGIIRHVATRRTLADACRHRAFRKARCSAIISRMLLIPGGQCVPASEIMQPSG